MKSGNKKASAVTRGLIEYLKKSGQLAVLPELVRETLKKSQTQKDPSKAYVTTAIELSSGECQEIEKALSEMTGRQISVENMVDQDVLAGMKIEIGDRLIDNTMRSKLQNLSERLSQ